MKWLVVLPRPPQVYPTWACLASSLSQSARSLFPKFGRSLQASTRTAISYRPESLRSVLEGHRRTVISDRQWSDRRSLLARWLERSCAPPSSRRRPLFQGYELSFKDKRIRRRRGDRGLSRENPSSAHLMPVMALLNTAFRT